MINTLHFYSHTILGIIEESIPALRRSIEARVTRIAVSILIQAILSIPLFYLHPNLFVLGFTIGFILHGKVREIAGQVNIVYSTNRTLLEQVCLFGGLGFLAILTMPISLVILTVWHSAQWGTILYQDSLARYRKDHALFTPSTTKTPITHRSLSEPTTPSLVSTSEDNT